MAVTARTVRRTAAAATALVMLAVLATQVATAAGAQAARPHAAARPASEVDHRAHGRRTTSEAPGSTPADRLVRDRHGATVGAVRAAATTAAAQRAVRAYWTPARMRAARPLAPTTSRVPAGAVRVRAAAPAFAVAGSPLATSGSGRVDRPSSVGAAADRAHRGRRGAVTGADWPTPSPAKVARTTGKVFFTLDGTDYVCSGSAVASADDATVLTAGHCVNAGGDGVSPGAYASSWLFVPGYDTDGVAPYGEFPATHLATTTGWRTLLDDFDDDVAFANVATNDVGQTLGEAVGGLPVGFDRARGERVTVLGYPAAYPYDGLTLTYCRGYVVQDTYGGSPDQGLRCDMTPGSSGGPWVGSWDPSTGGGTLVSVTSFLYSGLDGYLWGPYLGATAKALYTSVASTTSA